MSLSFDPITSDFFLWTILILVLGIGLASVFFYGKKGISKNRLWVKTGLFFGFWAFLAISLLRPQVSDLKDSKLWLVYGEGLEQAELDFWMDSLGLDKSVGISDFDLHSDQVVLLGMQFSKEELYSLRGKQVSWILPREQGLIRDISWKGYLRKGEVQRVSFSVFSSKSDQKLSLGIPQSDSVALDKGWNEGMLELRPSGQGRVELPLVLEKDTLAILRYFIGPSTSKKYQVQMGFPSAESRTLANWLREKGETVSEQVQLSRETFLQSNPQSDSLQVRIIDPAQLNQKALQDWVKTGNGNLMIIQVGDPLTLNQQVNRLFGTDFELEPAKTELENGLDALPFSWKEKAGQEVFQENRIAIQRLGNAQIGISLLESTYPLLLEGKMESYEEIWGEVFGAMEPAEPRSKRLDAPVFQSLEAQIQLFDQDSLPEIWSAGEDTVWLKRSAINPFLAKGIWQATSIGWIDSGTDFSVYSYQAADFPAVSTARFVSELQQDYRKAENEQYKEISPWIGLIGMLLFLGAMWLEPKL
ncbi:hypothetical protein Aoki45_01970 [Algoriphagus sp. oki45]|uniref:hypothetical protein n=1 Tax=Algoriphagus sp. oki45 TaxID=3067294 RepID=UPI0027F43E02|nr:hypothetical protein Aoki45_01970 [Algoriphagus sp. oki45]